ncbi:MAG: NBR1-Ig-like domain-containing protein [Anaerolineales bacterium]|nr:MAG: NBR1-Ig-like domain-containing protein [Anaerolineales bacterium]
MKLTTNSIIIIFGILALCVLAMFPISVLAFQSGQPKADPQATVQAMVTQTVIALTLNAPTQTPPPPTPTLDPATQAPTATVTSPAPTAVTYCDWVAFVKDVTVADGTTLAPGEVFIKTWRLKNRGTCAWTTDYMLVFNSGSQMGGTTAVRLPGHVAPGQTVDVSVTLTAPSTAGSYSGYWMLRNAAGTLFGTGDKANVPFYVDIKVKKQETVTHGTVGGNLCYPSEFNPPMTLYLENAHTGQRIQFAIVENQITYSVLVPAGRYYAYAWAPGYNLEGAYTHSSGLMKSFFVEGGSTTPFINLCDWSPNPHARGE